MKSRHTYAFILFYFTLILNSCTKTEVLPDLKGNMVGYVYTFGEFAPSEVPADNSGVLVIALGKNEAFRTFSDVNGRFEFGNLPAGTYELQFLKEGFGTLKQFGIRHLGGEPTVLSMGFDHSRAGSAFILHEIPATEITELRIDKDSIYCRFKFKEIQPENICIRLYVSQNEIFDSNSADIIVTNFSLAGTGSLYTGGLYYYSPYETHQGLPFKSGEKIFFRACASPFYGVYLSLMNQWYIEGIETYFDYENNRLVYPALGKESDQKSYIIP